MHCDIDLGVGGICLANVQSFSAAGVQQVR